MKKFLKLWAVSFMIMTLTHFLGLVFLLGSSDLTIIGGSYILALLFSIIPTAIYSTIVVFGSPYIKNKYLKATLQSIFGILLLGFPPIMAVINTIIVMYHYYSPEPLVVEEPIKFTKTYRVYDNEIVGRPVVIGPEQLLLSILKEKGAPITGTIYFKIEDGYEIEMFPVPHRNCKIYHFTK